MNAGALLGGYLPARRVTSAPLDLPDDAAYAVSRRGTGTQKVATTMAFVRLLKDLMKDPRVGHRFVPIIPDEARTFGLDSLFRSKKIYSPLGQTYLSVDRELLMSYQEDIQGVLLHEGITEAGSAASWTAAGTSYATHGEPMIPLYIFYSMFGFQRTGDGFWAAADQMTRGFLLGATAGRTTLNGEGLQHQDGHSLLLASTNPACLAYDAAYAFELGHIVAEALRRMYGEPRQGEDQNVFYYLTLYNEPIVQPAQPAEVDVEGILAGMHRYSPAAAWGRDARADPGLGHRHALGARGAGTSSAGLVGEGRRVVGDLVDAATPRGAGQADEWNMTHPDGPRREAYVASRLRDAPGPVVAVSDWMRAVPDQIAPFVPGTWSSLGTDGFGLSDTRRALRQHFGVDAPSIVLRVLEQLVNVGALDRSVLHEATKTYGPSR